MNINSVQGSNAYTNVQNTTPTVDTAKLKEQNLDASKTEFNSESTTVAQHAFEVTITQQAQQLSAKNNETTAEVATQQAVQPLDDQNNQNTESVHETSQIVNIVA